MKPYELVLYSSMLKPCPFCGSKAKVTLFLGRYGICCEGCPTCMIPNPINYDEHKDTRQLVRYWNERKDNQEGNNEMRLIDANELLERVGRDRLDSRELIADMIEKAPTVHANITLGKDEIREIIAKKYGVSIDKVEVECYTSALGNHNTANIKATIKT